MNKLKFETNSFGIKRCIINTNSRWVDYSVYESFNNLPDKTSKVLNVETREPDNLYGDNDFEPELFLMNLDFETNGTLYYKNKPELNKINRADDDTFMFLTDKDYSELCSFLYHLPDSDKDMVAIGFGLD